MGFMFVFFGINSLLFFVNVGKVDNCGFEFNLGVNGNLSSKWCWRVGINGGYVKNEVVFMDEVFGVFDY